MFKIGTCRIPTNTPKGYRTLYQPDNGTARHRVNFPSGMQRTLIRSKRAREDGVALATITKQMPVDSWVIES